jgi:L-evernosamine nitrososynthase
MDGEPNAITEAGTRFVALAEEHAADFATRADQHDREGSFPFENFESMKKSGFMAAPAPSALGGLGLTSLHDLAVGMSRLGRGCASTAIAVNMHLASVWTMGRMLAAEPEGELAPAIDGLLKGIVAGQITTAVAGTEAGTDIAHPQTTATATDNGYLLNGTKIFGTLSPVANVFFSPVRVAEGNGGYSAGLAMVFRGTPGMDIKDNWDALGMRGSGSNDVIYTDCLVPAASIMRNAADFGEVSAIGVETAISGNVGLIAVFMGIAETARDAVVATAKTRRKAPSNRTLAERPSVQHLIGELDVDIAVCRSMVAHIGRQVDAFSEAYPRGRAPVEVAMELDRQFQCAKLTVNRRAIDAVDKALTASGGAGYLTKSPLSRLYRDVRAGPFMQPFAPHEALEFIGRVALGQDPALDR